MNLSVADMNCDKHGDDVALFIKKVMSDIQGISKNHSDQRLLSFIDCRL